MTLVSWFAVMVVVGGMYVVGPDLCSRVLVAENDAAARRGAVLAGLALVPISIAIVLIGIRIRSSGVVLAQPSDALPWLMAHSGAVHPLVGGFIGGGLLAAMLSSADTCLLTAATVVELDLVPERRTGMPPGRVARVVVVVVAGAGAVIAAVNPGIIANLLLAYAFYSGGLLLPLLMAASPRLVARLDRRCAWGAMALGGMVPVAAVSSGFLTDLSLAGLLGVTASAIVLAAGLIVGTKV